MTVAQITLGTKKNRMPEVKSIKKSRKRNIISQRIN
jgi:hypothetical protein